jgi:histidine ammonia-lyase
MKYTHTIELRSLQLSEIQTIIHQKTQLEISEEVREKVQHCRAYLDKKIAGHDALIYGVNTGFGSLCNTAISNEQLEKLQRNLVLSHACGMGEEVPEQVVRLMLLFKILGLSKGHSGVQFATIERLVYFFNEGIFPVVFQQGSLGASGDLAPLAHLSLPLIGEGKVRWKGKLYPTAEVYKKLNLKPINLQSKEGLALLNGTQFMSAYAFDALDKSWQLWHNWHRIAALSLDAFDGRKEPFHPSIHEVRPHEGQIISAALMTEYLSGSEIIEQEKAHVQDPYSFRCIPQVHGATYDTLKHAEKVILTEINAVTDNPTIFPDEDEVISAGNFHGQPLALVMDFLAIALSEMGSISERRVYKLISGTRALPAFLTPNPGLNSGFMITQYACASIVSQNKQLCTPASVDTIDSSNGQEDHVSMGANAATKLFRVVDNCFSIQGIELLLAAQAIEFRRPLKSSDVLEALFAAFRAEVPFVEEDVYLNEWLEKSRNFVQHLN